MYFQVWYRRSCIYYNQGERKWAKWETSIWLGDWWRTAEDHQKGWHKGIQSAWCSHGSYSSCWDTAKSLKASTDTAYLMSIIKWFIEAEIEERIWFDRPLTTDSTCWLCPYKWIFWELAMHCSILPIKFGFTCFPPHNSENRCFYLLIIWIAFPIRSLWTLFICMLHQGS